MKRKLPSESVVKVRLYPVIEFSSVTLALGTDAPLVSLTAPVIVPALPNDCAANGKRLPSNVTRIATTVRYNSWQKGPYLLIKMNLPIWME